MQPLYDLESVRSYWEELKNIGVEPLTTAEQVDDALKNSKGTTLVVVNSVCGCAAGHARPGVGLALQNKVIPDKLYTVFAGVDRDATRRAREHITDYGPSSPSAALFKDGKLVFMLERSQIESANANAVAEQLIAAFNQHCSSPGPSVPKEVFVDNFSEPRCSSDLPEYEAK